MPSVLYQIEQVLRERLSGLRPAQIRGLAVWVYGTVLASSACQNAVIGALSSFLGWHTARQRLREWLADGQDKARPTKTQVTVETCFVPLCCWALSLWSEKRVLVAIDSTHHSDKNTVLVVSLLFRSCALPLAWQVMRANKKGEWIAPLLRLLSRLQEAVPAYRSVVVMADRGLWSPRLFRAIKEQGWHPLMRVHNDILFAPEGQKPTKALNLLPEAHSAWIGSGVAFKPQRKLEATLVAVWLAGQKEACLCLTDLRPRQIDGLWYGLRMWIEASFRCLKSVGWHWDKTQRTDCERVARHWLVLAVATLWTLACGSRVEDALVAGLPPARVLRPRPVPAGFGRKRSVFACGLVALQRQMQRGRLWQRWWLGYQSWPKLPTDLQVILYEPT